MKNFINTLSNIWKVEELRKRILTTLSLILIYRIGSYVVLPGVDTSQLGSASNPISELLNLFAGGAFSRASIFALGIMPYISASIIMQLMGIAVPSVQKLQKEGESGRKKINNYTRYLTIILCAVQAPGYLWLSVGENAAPLADPFWMASSVVVLVAGTMFMMWLGERITDKGIGNGISLIIMIGIIANLPKAFAEEFTARQGNFVTFVIEMAIFLLVILVTILIVQGVRKVPVQYAKSIAAGGKAVVGQPLGREYFPVRVNAAGVMPIIFAQAIMFLPSMLASQFPNSAVIAAFGDIQGFGYNFTFAIMIILFTYFYTAITINPNQIADDLKRNGGFVPGIKPGRDTAEYIDSLISRITLPGSIMLAIVAILPVFAMNLGVKQNFAFFFGGTSLIIMVGVVLDTLQQIESHLLNRHYDGLMKSGGKIRGREAIMSSEIG